MRLLIRASFTFVALLSLLLWLGTAGLCVRSWFVGDMWLWYDRDCQECANVLRSGAGRIQYAWSDNRMLTGINPPPGHYTDGGPGKGMQATAGGGQPHLDIPGAHYERYGAQSLEMEIHDAWPLVLLGIVPAVWVYRRRAGLRRRKAGCCPGCGYDLRATPERCPECGRRAGEGSV